MDGLIFVAPPTGFDVTIVRDGLWGMRSRKARAVRQGTDGLRVESDRLLAAGQKVRLKFRLPRSLSQAFEGLNCDFAAEVRDVPFADASAKRYSADLRLQKPMSELVEDTLSAHRRRIGFLILALWALTLLLKWSNLSFFWYTPAFYTYSFLVSAFFLSRFVIAARHVSPPLGAYEPTISIVISVRNEEKVLASTVESCYRAEYPPEKKEVIVVDDGSTDDTPGVLKRLRGAFPGLKVYTLPPSGKRFGMAEGVLKASGELVAFVDSDTFLFPDSVRRIVCGFEDPTLGAVSGHTEVGNADVNWLTGLQEVRYYVSFLLMKTSESFFGCVTCCPGSFSAYRRSYVLDIIEPWLNQRFLGAQATFGDDRSLTNFILRNYRVIYNETAVASTLVPETWRHYLTQQVRWKKSWLRETLIAARFIYRKHPIAALSFYISALCSVLSPWMVFRAVYIGISDQDTTFLYYSIGLLTMGFMQCLFYLQRRPHPRWLLGMVMVASQVVVMGPQTYYAILTMRKNHWGTR